MLTTSQKEAFGARGLIRLEGFLPAEKVSRAREAVWRALERRGVWRDGTWRLDERPLSTAPNAGSHLVRDLKRRREIVDLITEEVLEVVAELLDERLVFPMTECPQILFTLPNAASWTVPHNIWHLDLPRLPGCGIPGVQLFTFLDTVTPGGGGTLAVAGSHRLLNESKRISSKQLKKRLKREPYFRDLMSKDFVDRNRFVRESSRASDVELQVVEMHGEPRDVFFMDLRILHRLAPNAARVPRIMVTQRFLLESLRGAVYGGASSGDPDLP
jgi:ectoine hydroxylase-related dioxygenase (phytanoyl-CoA dioxygenase family)